MSVFYFFSWISHVHTRVHKGKGVANSSFNAKASHQATVAVTLLYTPT